MNRLQIGTRAFMQSIIRSPLPHSSQGHVVLGARPLATFPRCQRPSILTRIQKNIFLQRHISTTTPSSQNDAPQSSTPSENNNITTLYFDNIFPIKLNRFDFRSFLVSRYYATDHFMEKHIKKLLPPTLQTKVHSIQPCVKEGGLFINIFRDQVTISNNAIEKEVQSWLAEGLGDRIWFNFQKLRAFVVKGKPFFEDISSRLPSLRLKVTFENGPEISAEQLYSEFRPYGYISDISILFVKEGPKYAIIQFRRIRSATSAKNCLHNTRIFISNPSLSSAPETPSTTSTRLNITYEPVMGANFIVKWLTSHPRITIPAALALLAAITYAIFDPLRVFFITNKITNKYVFNLLQSSYYQRLDQWVRKDALKYLYKKSDDDEDEEENTDENDNGLDIGDGVDVTAARAAAWEEREGELKRLRAILSETPSTFTLILGPHGSGKSKLTAAVMPYLENKLVIDCDDLVNAPDEGHLLSRLASQVGFFPAFTGLSNYTYWIDTMLQASGMGAGKTSGGSGANTGADAQVKKILEMTMIAITKLVVENSHKRRLEMKKAADAHKSEEPTSTPTFPPNTKPAVPHAATADLTAFHHPVIVIRGFMGKERAKNQFIYDALAEWASFLVENRVAHVVFVASNQSSERVLSKALPNRAPHVIHLFDASTDNAYAYIRRRLGTTIANEPEIRKVLERIGGRLTDLESLVQKVRAGTTVSDAFFDILSHNISMLRKLGFGEDAEDAKKLPWTVPQLWHVIKTLSKSDEAGYDEIRMSALFKGDEAALKAMESMGIIQLIQSSFGRPYTVRPGKPIFKPVFEYLVNDIRFYATMGILTNKQLAADEMKKIEQYESEMARLSSVLQAHSASGLSSQTRNSVDSRMTYLAGLLKESSTKIEAMESEMSEFKKQIKF